MAEIDKALPNVKQSITIPPEEETIEVIEEKIQEQTDQCKKKYCVFLKYEPEETPSNEIATVILTNKKPIVRQT